MIPGKQVIISSVVIFCNKRKKYYESKADSVCQKKKMYSEKNAMIISDHKNQRNLMNQERTVKLEKHIAQWERNENNDVNRGLNAIGNGSPLDLSLGQIKSYLKDQLKSEHVEKLVQTVKDKHVMLLIVNGHKNWHGAHIHTVCDCVTIGMEEVKFIKNMQLLINFSKFCVSVYEQ